MQFFDRMKKKWGVGPWGVIAILLAFALTGMTVLRLKGPVMGFLLPEDAPKWVSWVVYLIVILPVYHVCLLTYGTLLGQGAFFWQKSKKVGRFLFGWIRPRGKHTRTRPGRSAAR